MKTIKPDKESYFLKIISKNDAGWFKMSDLRPTDGSQVNILNWSPDPGYFTIPSSNPGCVSPLYCQLNLTNDKVNLITCKLFRWRDVNGDPGGRPYWSKVKFLIVHIPSKDYHQANNGEIPVTDTLDLTAKDYGDDLGLTLLINPENEPKELRKINNERYNEWMVSTGRRKK